MKNLSIIIAITVIITSIVPVATAGDPPIHLFSNGLKSYATWTWTTKTMIQEKMQAISPDMAWFETASAGESKIIQVHSRAETHFFVGKAEEINELDVVMSLAKKFDYIFFASKVGSSSYKLLIKNEKPFTKVAIGIRNGNEEWYIFKAKKIKQAPPAAKK